MRSLFWKGFGGMAVILLFAGQVAAAVFAPSYIYLPPSPDADGFYQMRWRASGTKGVTYTLEEATDAGFTTDLRTVYTGTLYYTYVGKPTKNLPGTYYYRVKASLAGVDSSWTEALAPIVVSDPALQQVAPPSGIRLPTADADGKTRVIIDRSATVGATYEMEYSTDGVNFTNPVDVSPAGTANYTDIVIPANGTYYFRARAVKAPMVASTWKEAANSIQITIPPTLIGTTTCQSCHTAGGDADPLVQGDVWDMSRHGNGNGLPNIPGGSCANCHNPNGEYASFGVPVVGCEACHGVGFGHAGPAIDALAVCGKCHDGHQSNIATKVTASMHNAGTRFSDSCQRCHSIEGFQNLIAQAADPSANVNYTPISPALTAATAPTCTACHDSHSGALRAVPGWDPNQNGVADQFDTCTACHNYYDNSGVLMAGSTSASNTFYHATSWYRLLPTTHYDNPATGIGTGPTNILEGYVIRQNGPNPCFDCHSHDLRVNTRRHLEAPTTPDRGETIWTEWAQSGHAGKLLTAKEAAVAAVVAAAGTSQDQVDATLLAGSNGAEFAWNHYPWSKTSKLDLDGVTVVPDRGDCQKCHTATGYVNKAADPAGYDFNNNDFSHLQDWTALAGSGQAELLYCWGCHSSVETGALRVTGAVTLDYTYGGAAIVIPDLGKSSACIPCHAGRGNANEASRSSRFAGHHAVAGATLFSAQTHVGYEFTGQNYANVPYFAHNNIGVATGEGPCAACHMNGASHKFEVVTKDAGGIITGINSEVCVSCHDGEHALFVAQSQVGTTAAIWDGTAAVPTVITQEMADAAAAILEEEAEGYKQAGAILVALTTNAITNYLGHDMNAKWDHDADPLTADVAYYTTDPIDAYGAFQNSKLAADEPGAFAHNRYYAKRLIFDSIDFLEDGAITGVIADYSATYPEAALWLGTLRP